MSLVGEGELVLSIDAAIDGASVPIEPRFEAPVCARHSPAARVVVAIIDGDDAGAPATYQAKVTFICTACPADFAVVYDTARAPRDGSPGVVVDLVPL